MNIFSGLFFIVWTVFSGFMTVMFAGSIHKDVQSGSSSAWMYFILLFPLSFVLIGLWGLYTSFLGVKSGFSKKIRPKTEFAKGTTLGVFFFGLPFFVAGVGVMVFLSIVPVVKSVLAMGWDRAPAEVTHSQLKTNYDSDGNTYKADVHFRYTYEGQVYHSKTYDFQIMSTGSEKGNRKKVDSAPVGSLHDAYVNPWNPNEAVLSVKLSWVYLFTFIFGAIFAAVGGALVFSPFFKVDKGEVATKTLPKPKLTPGPVVLRCRYGGPVAKFIGLFIFTIIWDGVVLILFKQDAPVWFKGVFGFFAVIITFAFGHSFLSLFNPRPVLQVSSKHARLGGSVNLNWKMRGQVQKIESFTITLIGQEEATYRRGTDTYTDRAVFHQQVMAEYLHGHIPPMGTCAIKIPRVSMHTWKSQNNKILWLIKVNGKIRKWPDINEEYEIMVLPY